MEYHKQSSQAHSTTRRMQADANGNLDIIMLLTNELSPNVEVLIRNLKILNVDYFQSAQ